jgi:hypothetical protein
LFRLDESQLQNSFSGRKESAKDFAVSVSSPHDFTLAASPIVLFAKGIEYILDLMSKTCILGIFGNDLIAMSLSDDVIDSVFKGIERELIGIGKQPAFGAEKIERFVGVHRKGVRS